MNDKPPAGQPILSDEYRVSWHWIITWLIAGVSFGIGFGFSFGIIVAAVMLIDRFT